jgi:flagellar P-ring protein precursor FlgI
MKQIPKIVLAFGALCAMATPVLAQTRLKDIAVVQGVRSNQLVGYGLVVGLNGTGDGTGSVFTPQTVASMLEKFGVTIPASTQSQMQLKNVAAVMVTADLPAFVRNGSTIDVVVSSLGDAKSLQGGTLLQTPLQAANGKIYAAAQGPLSVGGFTAGSGGGGGVTQNHPTVGRVPSGALVEQEVPTTLTGEANDSLSVTLDQPDYTTASRVAEAIQAHLPPGVLSAHAVDAGTIQVMFTAGTDTVAMIAGLESLPIETDEVARIVINERTGTIVMSGNATVTACAVAHGDLTVEITNAPIISQPAPRSNGKTVVQPGNLVKVHEDTGHLVPIANSMTIDRVIRSLNALGATPRDLITILQAMKDAGALHAEIEVE